MDHGAGDDTRLRRCAVDISQIGHSLVLYPPRQYVIGANNSQVFLTSQLPCVVSLKVPV